jgi:hypothetical protein
MNNVNTLLISTLIAAAAITAGLIIHSIIKRFLIRGAQRQPLTIGGLQISFGNLGGPLRILVPAIRLGFVLPALNIH